MAGGLLQLVAYGAQDQFLTGDPTITFFKSVYRHHTNFSMESIRQDFNGTAKPNNKISATISRNGDLITDCWLEFKVKNSENSDILNGESVLSLIKTVELEIGGQRIDRHTGDWLRIWSELSLPHEKKSMYDRYVNQIDEFIANDPNVNKLTTGKVKGIQNFYVPLQFFFCKNPGLALPLIALQYHEVKVIIEFNDFGSESKNNTHIFKDSKHAYLELGKDVDLTMYVNYVYLDVDERRRFAQTSHQMLIEQLQYTEESMLGKNSLRVNFNHPVKELIWVYQTNFNKWGYYDYDGNPNATSIQDSDPEHIEFFSLANLKLNNQDRFSPRPPEYFRFVQPYQYHTRVPSIPIYVYSFALKPEEHQPSGTCNFSRIDNAYLNFVKTIASTANNNNLGITDINIKLFAVNYNILRITSGMGGLAFSN